MSPSELSLTEEQVSVVMTVFVDSYMSVKRSLCCAPDADEACEAIMGTKRGARALREWYHDRLGCGIRNAEDDMEWYLGLIAGLLVKEG